MPTILIACGCQDSLTPQKRLLAMPYQARDADGVGGDCRLADVDAATLAAVMACTVAGEFWGTEEANRMFAGRPGPRLRSGLRFREGKVVTT